MINKLEAYFADYPTAIPEMKEFWKQGKQTCYAISIVSGQNITGVEWVDSSSKNPIDKEVMFWGTSLLTGDSIHLVTPLQLLLTLSADNDAIIQKKVFMYMR